MAQLQRSRWLNKKRLHLLQIGEPSVVWDVPYGVTRLPGVSIAALSNKYGRTRRAWIAKIILDHRLRRFDEFSARFLQFIDGLACELACEEVAVSSFSGEPFGLHEMRDGARV